MITYSNTSKLLFSQGNDNIAINLKSKASQGTSDPVFKSVFDNTLNNTAKRTNPRNVSENDDDISQNSDSKIKYKSFRDVENYQKVGAKQNSVEKPAEDSKSQNVDLEAKKITNDPDAYDESINVLAQMLGLQPSELVKIAKELGFSAEDLKDVKKLGLFMNKLASVLELNDSQKNMMNTLAKEVSKEVTKEVSKEVSKQVKTEDGLERVPTIESPKAATNEAKTSNNTETIDLSKTSDEVKEKLNQLIQKATSNSESVSSDVSKVIKAMRAQKQTTVSVNSGQVDTKSITKAPTTDDIPSAEQLSTDDIPSAKQLAVDGNVVNVKESAKASNSKEEDNSESAGASDTKTEVAAVAVNTQVSASNDQNEQQILQPIGDIKVDMLNKQTEVQKAALSMPQPIKSSEVINQLVESAKVIIGQDKSEMIIQLKPDHLGKLELKVVTEQGIVAAKFIAESQKVKEIIETNMQLLKDSLQKQGISIDSVSVQVGHDKQSEYQQQNPYQGKNNSSGNRLKNSSNESGISRIGINAFDALPERLAQYAYDSNTINLTA
ncbi:MAG TPA: flagellar hook-length control protein FliK [Ruminiclostridium sp.]